MNKKLKNGLLIVFGAFAGGFGSAAYLAHQNKALTKKLMEEGFTPVSVTTNLLSKDKFTATKNDGSILVTGTNDVFLGTPSPKYETVIKLK